MSSIRQCQSCALPSARADLDQGRWYSRGAGRSGQVRTPDQTVTGVRSVNARSAQSETSYQLTVRTEDGDVVTISARALSASRSENDTSFSQSRDSVSTSSYRGRQRESSVEVSIQVEGNLSQEEIDDIRELTSTLARATRQVDRGDTGGALRTSLRAANADDSIAGFDFAYQRTRQSEEVREQQISYVA